MSRFENQRREVLEAIEALGPWPFTSRRIYRHPDGTRHEWRSRHHRKGLRVFEPLEKLPFHRLIRLGLWLPKSLNWWIGTIFAAGSLLFAAGSILALAPSGGIRPDPNVVFFLGSVPFTIAAYLQLFQAANAPDPEQPNPLRRARLFGWKPSDIGWLSCFLQFLGTLFFNANTFDANLGGLNWWRQDLAIWVPDFLGSLLFLASGYLAYAEAGHGYLSWRPRSLPWEIAFFNLLGCLAFMASAFLSYIPKSPFAFPAAPLSLIFTLLGAIGFLAGSLLLLPEASDAGET